MCKAVCALCTMEMPVCVVSVLLKELLVIDYAALENIVVYYLPLLCPSDVLRTVLRYSNTAFVCRELTCNTFHCAARLSSVAVRVAYQDMS